jgi:carboxyl-terminal processing protease
LRLRYFNQTTWGEFDKAVKEIILLQPKGIIFDLRSNPGGFLETSIDVASEWVANGIIVSEGPTIANKKDTLTRGKHRLAGIPTIVLVDEGTASGSEIVAGAIQDHKAGTIVGIQTYGKGSVQELEPFSDGSALKLTIAKWFTPSGQEINKVGITPDVKLEKMFEQVKNAKGEVTEIKDLGVEKAVEILK